MKIHWLIPLTVDAVFQFTSKNELARSFTELGNEMTTTVAYRKNRIPMDGFTSVEYIRVPSDSILRKVLFHWRMIHSALSADLDVVMFGFQAAHLIPIVRLAWCGRRRPVFIMDIRTIPVDISFGLKGLIEKIRYWVSLKLCDTFCDGVTVITSALSEEVKPWLRRLHDRIGIWTSGVTLSHFERQGPSKRAVLGLNGKKILIYHGILSPNRGLQNVVEAVHLLLQEMPNLVFLIVGDGEGKVALEDLVNKLNLTDNVIFTGKVPYHSIPEHIRAADCAILPFPDISWWRVSSPIKLMEYLAVGIPIVATDIDAHRHVAKETGGIFLVKNEQPENLAKSIQRIFMSKFTPVTREVLEDRISWISQARKLILFIKNLGPKR